MENKDFFEGYWENNEKNGLGKFYKNSKLVYFGEFKDGKYHGKGIEIGRNKYSTGDFEKGKFIVQRKLIGKRKMKKVRKKITKKKLQSKLSKIDENNFEFLFGGNFLNRKRTKRNTK